MRFRTVIAVALAMISAGLIASVASGDPSAVKQRVAMLASPLAARDDARKTSLTITLKEKTNGAPYEA